MRLCQLVFGGVVFKLALHFTRAGQKEGHIRIGGAVTKLLYRLQKHIYTLYRVKPCRNADKNGIARIFQPEVFKESLFVKLCYIL